MSRHKKVLILEVLTAGPGSGWYSRLVSHPNYHGAMASVVAVWCEELGASVTYRTYTGRERPLDLVAGEWDVAFISAYTRGAWTAYAASEMLRARGTLTALGGPHAQAYPFDSCRWFDFVLGFTDAEAVREVLEGGPHRRGRARLISREGNPETLPSLHRRAPFIDIAIRKAWLVRAVPLLASSGCPYSCSFCSDANVPFLPVDPERITDDVGFAIERWPGALLAWHDPNFGVRFDELLSAIERALDGRRARFLAQSTLSLLTTRRIDRLAEAGFVALLPGIENWTDYGAKMGLNGLGPEERMRAAASRLNDIAYRIPFLQVNFVFGVDPEGERAHIGLTEAFLHEVPAAWPNVNLIQAWGRLSPLSRALAEEERLLGVPFPLTDQKVCPNVRGDIRPSLEAAISVLESSITRAALVRRFLANHDAQARIVNLIRGLGAEQRRRIRWYRSVIEWLGNDPSFAGFFDGSTDVVPHQLRSMALVRLGPFARYLPPEIDEEARTGRRRRPLVEHSEIGQAPEW